MDSPGSEFVFAVGLDELKAKGKLVVHGGHRPILIVHDGDRVFALDNRCPHMGFPLDRGSIEEERARSTIYRSPQTVVKGQSQSVGLVTLRTRKKLLFGRWQFGDLNEALCRGRRPDTRRFRREFLNHYVAEAKR
jgi:nitrite reductase/ring-hydroxylating ferredoxin subunit